MFPRQIPLRRTSVSPFRVLWHISFCNSPWWFEMLTPVKKRGLSTLFHRCNDTRKGHGTSEKIHTADAVMHWIRIDAQASSFHLGYLGCMCVVVSWAVKSIKTTLRCLSAVRVLKTFHPMIREEIPKAILCSCERPWLPLELLWETADWVSWALEMLLWEELGVCTSLV